jgi:hypothetical protein
MLKCECWASVQFKKVSKEKGKAQNGERIFPRGGRKRKVPIDELMSDDLSGYAFGYSMHKAYGDIWKWKYMRKPKDCPLGEHLLSATVQVVSIPHLKANKLPH